MPKYESLPSLPSRSQMREWEATTSSSPSVVVIDRYSSRRCTPRHGAIRSAPGIFCSCRETAASTAKQQLSTQQMICGSVKYYSHITCRMSTENELAIPQKCARGLKPGGLARARG